MALVGTLHNRTGRRLRLSTRLSTPLYLRAGSGTAQNMMITAIYRAGGRYILVNDEPMIELRPMNTDVVFNAYCVDFAKENPSESDAFALTPLPLSLTDVGRRILDYEAAAEQTGTDDDSVIRRAQVALWMAQGIPPNQIRTKFTASDEDVSVAASIGGVVRNDDDFGAQR